VEAPGSTSSVTWEEHGFSFQGFFPSIQLGSDHPCLTHDLGFHLCIIKVLDAGLAPQGGFPERHLGLRHHGSQQNMGADTSSLSLGPLRTLCLGSPSLAPTLKEQFSLLEPGLHLVLSGTERELWAAVEQEVPSCSGFADQGVKGYSPPVNPVTL
jgi:hypothetical protein